MIKERQCRANEDKVYAKTEDEFKKHFEAMMKSTNDEVFAYSYKGKNWILTNLEGFGSSRRQIMCTHLNETELVWESIFWDKNEENVGENNSAEAWLEFAEGLATNNAITKATE